MTVHEHHTIFQVVTDIDNAVDNLGNDLASEFSVKHDHDFTGPHHHAVDGTSVPVAASVAPVPASVAPVPPTPIAPVPAPVAPAPITPAPSSPAPVSAYTDLYGRPIAAPPAPTPAPPAPMPAPDVKPEKSAGLWDFT